MSNQREARRSEIAVEKVPKNLTHLLQPLDLTRNGAIKKIERREFSNYFTSVVMQELLNDPAKDVTTIKVDLPLSVLKPLHFETLKKVMDFFKSTNGQEIIKSGFRSAGITDAIRKARDGQKTTMDHMNKLPCMKSAI